MKQMHIIPHGFPCKLSECPAGLFLYGDSLALKTEYGNDSYLVSSGEAFWGGTKSKQECLALMVQPCIVEIIQMEI